MTGHPDIPKPEISQNDESLILADLRRLQDLRVLLASCRKRLKELKQEPLPDLREIEEEKVNIVSTIEELQRIRRLIAVKGFGQFR